MLNYEPRRIILDEVKIGMVLDEDVINSNGMLLIQKGSIITQKHIFRMKLYQILSIVIRQSIDHVEPQQEQQVPKRLKNSVHFKAFETNYEQKHEVLQQHLLDISEGNHVELNDLFNLSNSLFTSLKSKSDLFSYLNNLKDVDDHTYTHCLNVSLLCFVFGQWLNYSQQKLINLTVAGLLHDIGKIQIDTSILNKPGKLTKEEFEIVKKHCELGYKMVQRLSIDEDIKMAILMHHEKIDGSGYPFGLKGDQIPDFAKIISILDIYDAMTSHRSYHNKYSPFKVIQMFEQESYGILDTKFLYAFLDRIAHNYVGRYVRLSTGEEGKIVFIHKNSPSRPMVQLDTHMVDLIGDPNIYIEEITR